MSVHTMDTGGYTMRAMRRCLMLLLAVAVPLGFAGAPAAHAATAAGETPQATATPAQASQATAIAATASPAATATPLAETVLITGETPEAALQVLAVATGELGYTEGPNNLTKYGQWAGDKNAAWCAEFVCWCVNQADRLNGTTLLGSLYPNYGGQNTGRDWFIARGRFVYRRGNCPGWGYQWLRGSDHLLTKNEYIPRPGDLIFFSYNEAGDTEHVALVEYSARAADGSISVHVVEGNNPSSVQRNTYSLNSSQVLGFGAVADVVDTTMRMGCQGDKVLILQQRLTQLGFLEQKHQTGEYGSNTKQAVAAWQRIMDGKTANGIADRQTQQAIEAAVQRLLFDSPDTWLVEED